MFITTMSSKQHDHDRSSDSMNASCAVCNVETIVVVCTKSRWDPEFMQKVNGERGWHIVRAPGDDEINLNSTNQYYGRHIVYSNLQQSAKNGCYFCRHLDRGIRQAHPEQDFNRVLILRINSGSRDLRTLSVQLFFAGGITSEIEIFAESC
jgi:hypothetical protein